MWRGPIFRCTRPNGGLVQVGQHVRCSKQNPHNEADVGGNTLNRILTSTCWHATETLSIVKDTGFILTRSPGSEGTSLCCWQWTGLGTVLYWVGVIIPRLHWPHVDEVAQLGGDLSELVVGEVQVWELRQVRDVRRQTDQRVLTHVQRSQVLQAPHRGADVTHHTWGKRGGTSMFSYVTQIGVS